HGCRPYALDPTRSQRKTGIVGQTGTGRMHAAPTDPPSTAGEWVRLVSAAITKAGSRPRPTELIPATITQTTCAGYRAGGLCILRTLCFLAVVPRAVDGRADAHHGRALGNGGGVVVAHAH